MKMWKKGMILWLVLLVMVFGAGCVPATEELTPSDWDNMTYATKAPAVVPQISSDGKSKSEETSAVIPTAAPEGDRATSQTKFPESDKATSQTKSPEGDKATSQTKSQEGDKATPTPTQEALDRDGSYTTCEDVALYLETYGELPSNFITKKEAQELGWNGGSLEPYAPGKCIGGDKFGNYEGVLPKEKGRTYRECDIDTLGAKSRGAKRIVYSNDGLIYYTEDHYESFTLLYE